MTNKNEKDRNIMARAYLAFDQFLVDRATEAVKVWNWTTGRTRAELANLMVVTGTVLLPTQYALNGDITGAGLFSGISGYMGAKTISLNRAQEKIDKERNNEVMIKDPVDEMYRRTLSGVFGSMAAFDTHSLHNAGLGTLAISHYIMRADYQKPRKNCVRRGLEKLAELARTTQPIPVEAKYGGYV